MFNEPPIIPFHSEIKICPNCREELNIYKTKNRKVFTKHIGCFFAKETQLYCDKCNNGIIYRAENLTKLLPENCNYGYDVIIYIGESMFIKHLQAIEIQILLKQESNISISISEIEYLSKKFII